MGEEDNDDLAAVGAFSSHIASGAKSLGTYDQMMKQILKTEAKKYQTSGKMNRALSDALRYQHKLTLAQKSADLVTQHLKMRDAMKKGTDSLSLFTGYLSSPVSPMTVFKKMASSIGDTISAFDRLKTVQEELLAVEKKLAKDSEDPLARNEYTRLKKEESTLKKQGAERTDNKGLFERLSGAKEFFNKHKLGMIIGAASAGILIAVLKKAFDVSPMFQAIKKLLNFGIMLILRPIGDFFGFVMRPVMVALLRYFIIPWYRYVYPVMKDLAKNIGKPLGEGVKAAADAVTAVHGTLTGIFGGGETGSNAATATMTVGAGAGVVGMAALEKKTHIVAKMIKPIVTAGVNIISKIPIIGGSVAKVVSAFIPNILKKTVPNVVASAAPAVQKLAQGVSPLAKIASAAPSATPSAAKVIKPVQQAASLIAKVGQQVKNAAAVAQTSIRAGGKILMNLGRSIGVKGGVKLGAAIGLKGIPLVGWALAATDIILSPETLGGLIPSDSDWRLDKLMNKSFGTALSEDAEGMFQTIGLGKHVGLNEGLTSKMIDMMAGTGEGTGVIGGGAGLAKGNRGKNVIVNILGNVSKDVDVEHIGQTVENHIQSTNTQTSSV